MHKNIILCFLLISSLFCFTACTKKYNIFNEIDQQDDQQESQIINTETSTIVEVESSEEIKLKEHYIFKIDNIVLEYPYKLSDFITNGWEIDRNANFIIQFTDEIPTKTTRNIYLKNSAFDFSICFSCYNNTDTTQQLINCPIYGFSVYSYDGVSTFPNVTINNSIAFYASKEIIIESLGEPFKITTGINSFGNQYEQLNYYDKDLKEFLYLQLYNNQLLSISYRNINY